MLTRITLGLLLVAVGVAIALFFYQHGANWDSVVSVWRGYSDFDAVIRVATGFAIFVVVARMLSSS